MVVTAKKYPVDYKEGGIISPKADHLMEYQEVVAVSPLVVNVKVGDNVKIDLSRYAEWKYKKNSIKSEMEECTNQIVRWNIPTLMLDNRPVLFISLQDIVFVIEEFMEEPKESPILTRNSGIIL